MAQTRGMIFVMDYHIIEYFHVYTIAQLVWFDLLILMNFNVILKRCEISITYGNIFFFNFKEENLNLRYYSQLWKKKSLNQFYLNKFVLLIS